MRHPPYHLRPHKAVDRLLFVEILQRLPALTGVAIGRYTYYGLGGPFLDDCRALHQAFPDTRLVSFEKNAQTFKRQQFHKPTKAVTLLPSELRGYLAD